MMRRRFEWIGMPIHADRPPKAPTSGCNRCTPGTPSDRHAKRYCNVAVLLLLIGSAMGCSPTQLAKRTLFHELSEYPPVTDGRLSCLQYQLWARKQWRRIEAENPESEFSSDYASGFLQGFVDQVYAGGKVQPPPVPPRRYWRIGFRSPRGAAAIEQYFSGFEHGASIAREGGYRQRAVIPSSLYATEESDHVSRSERNVPQGDPNNSGQPTGNSDQEVMPPARPAPLTFMPTPLTTLPVGSGLEVAELSLAAKPLPLSEAGNPVVQEATHTATVESISDRFVQPAVHESEYSSEPSSATAAEGQGKSHAVLQSTAADPVGEYSGREITISRNDNPPPAPPWLSSTSKRATPIQQPHETPNDPANIPSSRKNSDASGDEFDPFDGSLAVPSPMDSAIQSFETPDRPIKKSPLPATDGAFATDPNSGAARDSSTDSSDDDGGWKQTPHTTTHWKTRR